MAEENDGISAVKAKKSLKEDIIKLAELDMHEELSLEIEQKPGLISQLQADTGDS